MTGLFTVSMRVGDPGVFVLTDDKSGVVSTWREIEPDGHTLDDDEKLIQDVDTGEVMVLGHA